MAKPIVEISEGKLQGNVTKSVNNGNYYTFKGIPYAKPPTGELRFSVPEPPEPWDGVRDATKDCNICPQFDRASNNIVGDEDCLFLNVYTPKLPNEGKDQLPVMVFIHGGGFLFGNGTDDSTHGPDYLVEKEVVVVSFNYRVGILGFLSLDIKEAPGNMGLRDQIQVLKWIQRNIDKFGGDPNNVTLLGFSAGAASVEYQLLSPLGNGLFHKAIAHSGSTLCHWAQNEKIKDLAKKICLLKNKVTTDSKEILKILKELNIKELISLSMTVLAAEKWRGGIYFAFVPTIEKPGDWEPFLSESTYKLLKNRRFMKVPYLTGFCSHEGLLVAHHSPSVLEKLTEEKNFLQHLPFDFDDSGVRTEIENKLKNIYFKGSQNGDAEDAFAINFFTDVDFLGAVYTAAKLIAKENPVYFYEFSYDGELNYLKKKLNIDRKGVCHGDDGGYIIKSSILTETPSDKDKLVRERLLQMWTSFARCGDPTPTTDSLITIKWEPITGNELNYLAIDSDLTTKYNPYPERTKLFEELYEKFYI